ncbi:hypothetical protein [Haloferula sp.]|uniref:hypothetical protein n=1 Tax=Haloferula sp. TaxID=2497595 RepID=UPI00329B6DD5
MIPVRMIAIGTWGVKFVGGKLAVAVSVKFPQDFRSIFDFLFGKAMISVLIEGVKDGERRGRAMTLVVIGALLLRDGGRADGHDGEG